MAGRKTWKLLSEFSYYSPTRGLIIIPEGFKTDFSSVPRIPLLYTVLGSYGQAAATIHDYLYSTKLLSRKESDKVFKDALRSSGIARWRAYLMWAAVRLFGGKRYGNN